MPLRLKEFLEIEGEIAVWITEDSENLLSKLQLTDEEQILIESMSDRRIKEWASARWLIHYLSGREERAICLKDAFGKPYLVDSPFQISVSHSLNYTAVIAAPYKVGIDIQELVPKMERIATKFVHPREWDYIQKVVEPLEMLHIIWGAKEAMYKAWGKRKIDFKRDLCVPEFQWDGTSVFCQASLQSANIRMHFDVVAKKVDAFMLVYVQEKTRYVE